MIYCLEQVNWCDLSVFNFSLWLADSPVSRLPRLSFYRIFACRRYMWNHRGIRNRLALLPPKDKTKSQYIGYVHRLKTCQLFCVLLVNLWWTRVEKEWQWIIFTNQEAPSLLFSSASFCRSGEKSGNTFFMQFYQVFSCKTLGLKRSGKVLLLQCSSF